MLAGSHPLWIEKTIHDTIYTIKQVQVTMQATRLNIQGITTSDQSLAGSHTFRTLKDNITKRTIYSKAYTSDQLENQQSTINQIKQHGRFSTAHTERT